MTTGTNYSYDVWTILDPLIANAPSVIVTIYAVWVATQQSRTAVEKLRLDFFDRRFRAWEALNNAINGRMAYLTDASPEDVSRGEKYTQTFLGTLRIAYRQAYFLFGPEVLAQIDRIESAMKSYLIARIDAADVAGAQIDQRVTATVDARAAYLAVEKLQDELMRTVKPYLDLANIAVIQPSHSSRFRTGLVELLNKRIRLFWTKSIAPVKPPSSH